MMTSVPFVCVAVATCRCASGRSRMQRGLQCLSALLELRVMDQLIQIIMGMRSSMPFGRVGVRHRLQHRGGRSHRVFSAFRLCERGGTSKSGMKLVSRRSLQCLSAVWASRRAFIRVKNAVLQPSSVPFGCVGFASCECCPATNGPLAVLTAFRLYGRRDHLHRRSPGEEFASMVPFGCVGFATVLDLLEQTGVIMSSMPLGCVDVATQRIYMNHLQFPCLR